MLDNLMDLLRAAEIGAICASKMVWSNDKNQVDQYAVDAINSILLDANFPGVVVLGEGELDNAPMLYVGQKFGDEIKYDIAIDPVEGTNPAAKNLPGAISTIAIAKKGSMLSMPEMYMEKLFVAQKYVDKLDINKGVRENVEEFLKVSKDLTAIVLDKPRHKETIDWFKSKNIKVILIGDGDVMGAIDVVHGNADFLWGIGGSPEGGLMAALALAAECEMIWSFVKFDDTQSEKLSSTTRGAEEAKILQKLGFKYHIPKFAIDLVNDEKAGFVATAITPCGAMHKVQENEDEYIVASIYARRGSVRTIESVHNKMWLKKKYPKLKEYL